MTRKKGSKKAKGDKDKVKTKIGTGFGKKKLGKSRINTKIGKDPAVLEKNDHPSDSKNFIIKFDIEQNFEYQPYTLVPFEKKVVNENMVQKKMKIRLPKGFLKSLDAGDINDAFGKKII